MAKLPSIEFKHENQTGEVMHFRSEVSITNDGTFSVTIPDELLETARANARARQHAVEVTKPPTAKLWRVSGTQLDVIKRFVSAAVHDHLACEVTTERIIAYNHSLDVAFCYASDGSIHPNGYMAQDAAGGSGNSGNGYDWEGNLNATITASLFAVGIAGRVFDKVTYRRASGVRVKYERVVCPGFKFDTPTQRLNSFVGLSMKPENCEQMPYSDEAAEFFYDAMLAMCKLAHQVKVFIGDKENLERAIANRVSMLPAPKSALESENS